MSRCCWKALAPVRRKSKSGERVSHQPPSPNQSHLRQRAANDLRSRLATLSPRQIGVHLMTLALVVLTFSLMLNFINQVVQSSALEARKVQLEEEVARLEAETRYLRGAVDYARSDAYVEQAAREQLGYARDGEVVVLPQFPDVALEPYTAPQAVPSAPLTLAPNWQRWWQALHPRQS